MNKLEHPSGISVELLDYLGNDLAIVNAARVSYGKESEWEEYTHCPHYQRFYKQGDTANYCSECEHTYDGWCNCFGVQQCHSQRWYKILTKADAGVLNYMMRDKHGSPFEMVVFKFRVHVPIGVGREWMRHRMGSFNEISTRYVKMEKEYYMPQMEDIRTQVGKAGHYTYEPITDGSESPISVLYERAMEQAFHNYERLLKHGLAREVARNVLPLGTFTTFIWNVNLRSLFNFLALRNESHALKEIQIAAQMAETLAQDVVPESFNLWRKYDRRAP